MKNAFESQIGLSQRIKIKIYIFDYLNNGHEVKIAHGGIKQSFSA